MGQIFRGSLWLIGLVLTYLLIWPVPIDPVKWDAPVSKGYTGAYIANSDLANLESLSIGESFGPEDVAVWNGADGIRLYASGQRGDITEIDPVAQTHRVIANTGGVPLGVEFGSDGILYVADAHKGLLSVTRDGQVTILTDHVEGTPIVFADDLDIGPDGVIYFSDASTKFSPKDHHDSLSASLLEIMEHRGTGRVLAYDPATQNTRIIKTGFTFSNGVVMHADGDSILVNETGLYSLHRIWVTGPKTGQSEIILDNLPGFPDNINRGPDIEAIGPTYLMGLVSQRSDWLDKNSKNTLARKIAMRLPTFMRPSAKSYGHIVQIDGHGNILKTWQDPSGRYPETTGAIIAPDGYMYVTSLSAKTLGRKPIE